MKPVAPSSPTCTSRPASPTSSTVTVTIWPLLTPEPLPHRRRRAPRRQRRRHARAASCRARCAPSRRRRRARPPARSRPCGAAPSASSPDTPQAMSDMWTMPSTSPSRPMNRPNSVAFLTSPSTVEPTGCLSANASHGFCWACLRPSEMRRLSSSTSRTTTSTSCEVETILPGWTFFLVQLISETWTRPSMPGFELDERTIFGDVGDAARELAADRILGRRAFPRIALELLHAEADALRVAVDADDLHLDGVTDVEHFATGG